MNCHKQYAQYLINILAGNKRLQTGPFVFAALQTMFEIRYLDSDLSNLTKELDEIFKELPSFNVERLRLNLTPE